MVVCILSAPLAGEAQPARKVYRVGYLSTQSPSAEAAHLDAFRQALRDLGYVDGQNVGIEYRFAEGKLDRLAGFAAELGRLKVDVIVTGGSPGAPAAPPAATTRPGGGAAQKACRGPGGEKSSSGDLPDERVR